MSRRNKKEEIARLHEQTILDEAEKLFMLKGINATTINDISRAAKYSRRTIYTYFENKDDIVNCLVVRGLVSLKESLIIILHKKLPFIETYYEICRALKTYQFSHLQSFTSINFSTTDNIDFSTLPNSAREVITLGNEVNEILEIFIDEGKNENIVISDINTKLTVQIISSSLMALHNLAHTKGQYLMNEFKMPLDDYLTIGYKQTINSILRNRSYD